MTMRDTANNLSEREEEVLDLLAYEGLFTQEIGKRLGITQSTVKRHLANCYAKMGVRNNVEAALKHRNMLCKAIRND